MTFEQLQKELLALKAEMERLKDTRNIPRATENALKYRLKGLYGAGTPGTFDTSINREIGLTGNVEIITVLENPAGYIPVEYQGTVYYVAHWDIS